MVAALWTSGLLAAAVLLTVAENRLIWGYWLSRPSVASFLEGVDRVLGISSLPVNSRPAGRLDHSHLSHLRSRCEQRTNECLEGKLLLALAQHDVGIGEIEHDLLDEVWSFEQISRPVPKPRDARYEDSANRLAGLGVHVRSGGEDYIALAYRTSEIANDRYIYSEALYRVSPKLEPVRRIRFFYEVAGLEFLDWRILFPLNLLCIAACATVFGLLRRRGRRQ